MMYEDNYLAHFGIKGMKWGVRRFQNEDGSLTTEGKERYNVGEVKRNIVNDTSRPASDRLATLPQSEVRRKKPKKLQDMTDQELQERINRLRNEQTYKQLMAEAKGKKIKKQDNRSFAQRHQILNQVFVNTATQTMSSLLSNQLQVKSDELLAERRKKRALEKGSLNPELAPFQYYLKKRNNSYNHVADNNN